MGCPWACNPCTQQNWTTDVWWCCKRTFPGPHCLSLPLDLSSHRLRGHLWRSPLCSCPCLSPGPHCCHGVGVFSPSFSWRGPSHPSKFSAWSNIPVLFSSITSPTVEVFVYLVLEKAGQYSSAKVCRSGVVVVVVVMYPGISWLLFNFQRLRIKLFTWPQCHSTDYPDTRHLRATECCHASSHMCFLFTPLQCPFVLFVPQSGGRRSGHLPDSHRTESASRHARQGTTRLWSLGCSLWLHASPCIWISNSLGCIKGLIFYRPGKDFSCRF